MRDVGPALILRSLSQKCVEISKRKLGQRRVSSKHRRAPVSTNFIVADDGLDSIRSLLEGLFDSIEIAFHHLKEMKNDCFSLQQ